LLIDLPTRWRFQRSGWRVPVVGQVLVAGVVFA